MTTKQEAIVNFQDTADSIQKNYPGDSIMLADAWNDYTDLLCRDKIITTRQYKTWLNPF